ncbi:hypothetical protein HDU89_001969 [Geranomyces variabilis]|nr:hypothetical protein HDU89_001969 [Geranomyces variabilis]
MAPGRLRQLRPAHLRILPSSSSSTAASPASASRLASALHLTAFALAHPHEDIHNQLKLNHIVSDGSVYVEVPDTLPRGVDKLPYGLETERPRLSLTPGVDFQRITNLATYGKNVSFIAALVRDNPDHRADREEIIILLASGWRMVFKPTSLTAVTEPKDFLTAIKFEITMLDLNVYAENIDGQRGPLVYTVHNTRLCFNGRSIATIPPPNKPLGSSISAWGAKLRLRE